MKRAKALESERVKLFASEKILKRQLHLSLGDSQEIKDLGFRLHGLVAKARRSNTIMKSILEQSLSVQFNVDKYHHRLPLHTERSTVVLTVGLSGFLYNLATADNKMVGRYFRDIKTTLKTDLMPNDAFLRSV